MQQDKNIENKLKQLDDQQQPDLSQMDEHWQQMQAMLQPNPHPIAKSISAKSIISGTIIGLLILAGGAFLLNSFKKGNTGNVQQSTNTTIAENKNVIAPVKKDTSTNQITTQQTTSIVPAKKYTANGNGNKGNDFFDEDGAALASMKINYTECKTCPAKNDSQNTAINRVQLLQDLLKELAKEEQHFTIDNTKDTLLQCAEGTVLLIPGNSLGGNNGIQFTVREFYKNSDIVLNQLTTLSNKEQLISGGMLELKASLNGKDVTIDPLKPIKLYMTDTSSNMNDMQLFNGEEKNISEKKTVNWVAQPQYFSNKKMVTQVRVLNLVNMPYNIKEKKDVQVAYFLIDDSIAISKDLIRETLKKKYGYNKVKLRSADWWETHNRNWKSHPNVPYFDSEHASRIGDSIWIEKELADRLSLNGTETRVVPENELIAGRSNDFLFEKRSSFNNLYDFSPSLLNKYSINLSRLGWINCDKFYKDNRKKIDYTVILEDSAKNYQTMLVFDRIKSVMNGYAVGKKVIFNDVPEGENMKVVSIGIDKEGKTVCAVQPAISNTQELTGLQFESTSAPDLKASLSKIDK